MNSGKYLIKICEEVIPEEKIPEKCEVIIIEVYGGLTYSQCGYQGDKERDFKPIAAYRGNEWVYFMTLSDGGQLYLGFENEDSMMVLWEQKIRFQKLIKVIKNGKEIAMEKLVPDSLLSSLHPLLSLDVNIRRIKDFMMMHKHKWR